MFGQEKQTVMPIKKYIKSFSSYDENGYQTYTLQDKLNNKFIQLGWIEGEIIKYWHLSNIDLILKTVLEKSTVKIDKDTILKLSDFLDANCFLEDGVKDGKKYIKLHDKQKQSFLKKAVYHYLYFRIPLVNPNKFLASCIKYTNFIYTKFFVMAIFALLFSGIYQMASRWSQFMHTFSYFFSFEKIVVYFLSLVLIKIFHELGHTITAKRMGAEVTNMGVAFIILTPILYSNVTDAWKIQSHKKRALISSGGVLTEFILAIIAINLWPFMQDGILKSIVFFLGTVNVGITLTINLNPFMRFDGYYLLSDLWNIANLQPRAFALTSWHMKKVLFGIKEQSPDVLTDKKRNRVIIYGYLTMVYRFFLFIGIAVLIYYMMPKAIGVLLFIIEIGVFIGKPILREIQSWIKIRDKITLNKNTLFTVLLFCGGIVWFVYPFDRIINIPAVFHNKTYFAIFPPKESRIKKVAVFNQQYVTKGQILFELENKQLETSLHKIEIEIENLERRFFNYISSSESPEIANVAKKDLLAKKAEYKGKLEEFKSLTIRSPMHGKIIDIPDIVKVDTFINSKQPMGTVISENETQITAYASEDEIDSIKNGMEGDFYAESINLKIPTKIILIDKRPIDKLDMPYMASIYNGQIPAKKNEKGDIIPQKNFFRVKMSADYMNNVIIRGSVNLKINNFSYFYKVRNFFMSLLIQESGF